MKETVEKIGGILSASNARIGYDYCTGYTAYTAWQCMAYEDSIGEGQESHILRSHCSWME